MKIIFQLLLWLSSVFEHEIGIFNNKFLDGSKFKCYEEFAEKKNNKLKLNRNYFENERKMENSFFIFCF